MRLVPLLVLLALAAPAFAQTPDTTAAWRYFPLEIGNVWEYQWLGKDTLERRSVTSDTLVGGVRFFRYDLERFEEDGQIVEETYLLRFDTLSATIQEEGGRPYLLTTCPLDAPFDDVIDCAPPWNATDTDGGFQEVEIGGDVVATTLKSYEFNPDLWEEFVAGIGYRGVMGLGGFYLEYARVGGVEYGEPIITAAEPPPAQPSGFALTAYPNPTRGAATLALTVLAPQTVTVEAFDVLGRRVLAETHAASGTTRIVLDSRPWKPGVYLVRATLADGTTSTTRLVRR